MYSVCFNNPGTAEKFRIIDEDGKFFVEVKSGNNPYMSFGYPRKFYSFSDAYDVLKAARPAILLEKKGVN